MKSRKAGHCLAFVRRFVVCLLFLIGLGLAVSQTPIQEQEDDANLSYNLQSCAVYAGDKIEDSMYDPFQADPDSEGEDSNHPPLTTLEEEIVSAMELSYPQEPTLEKEDQDDNGQKENSNGETEPAEPIGDQHWGSDPEVLRMRDALRQPEAQRPPIFLIPGLAASRLVAWKHKECRSNPLMSDIRVQDYVWLNLNLVMQMGTIDHRCFVDCIKLGINQTDSSHDPGHGCKLRPDEGLDAISSLSVGGIQSQLMIGHTNTVYSWLIQWLSDNLGYDVKSIIGFPYDWRLSPDKLEERDGFMTYMRRRIETAVETNGEPGILVAHSMGNLIWRYFLSWLRVELTAEAYIDVLEKSSTVQELKQFIEANNAGSRGSYRQRRKKRLGSLSDIKEKRGNTTHWLEAKREGDKRWHEWIEAHIWTYAGLSAPHLGAVNPLRAAISGETMGLPIAEETAREIELSFGSTLTINPVSSQVAFCDEWQFQEWDEKPILSDQKKSKTAQGCLDDLAVDIQSYANETHDPWRGFRALKTILHDRLDWDRDFPMIQVVEEDCKATEGSFCPKRVTKIGPREVHDGRVFSYFSEVFKEEGDPLYTKYEQLKNSFWKNDVPNMLSRVWDRPPIKHVIMAYGTDQPTEVAYSYLKRDDSSEVMCKRNSMPNLQSVLWETEGGQILEERLDLPKSIFSSKPKRKHFLDGSHRHSGDGSVPYLSLSFAHLWLLHGVRNQKASFLKPRNPLETIQSSYRPKGGTEWENGIPEASEAFSVEKGQDKDDDTGTMHPHGTKYKPEMHRFHSSYRAKNAGAEYTTTVIEASGVEHKETTRNYDILAAVFTDVLKAMHKDFDF